jgi:hypothetical protein
MKISHCCCELATFCLAAAFALELVAVTLGLVSRCIGITVSFAFFFSSSCSRGAVMRNVPSDPIRASTLLTSTSLGSKYDRVNSLQSSQKQQYSYNHLKLPSGFQTLNNIACSTTLTYLLIKPCWSSRSSCFACTTTRFSTSFTFTSSGRN